MSDIEDHLESLRESGLYRKLRVISGPQGPRVLLDGKPVLLLCSNNYLGLADHPRVREAAAEGAMRWGVGAGASRLVSGGMTVHRRLEEQLAEFKGSDACVLFGSGYLANTGIVSAVAREGEVVFSDALNHASIVDGCRLSKAETFVYRHSDMDHLEWGLQEAGGRGSLIVTDGVFSMDGDIALLEEIVELAGRYDARVMVDDAHGMGAIGPGGRGSVADAGLESEVDIVMGTLGKALGSYGAYACCDRPMAKYLVNCARTLIFSTALPPPSVAGALAALEMLRESPGPRRQAAAQRPRDARGAARRGPRGAGRVRDAHRPAHRRRRPRDDGRLRGRTRAGRLRPGHPPADGSGRDVAAAHRRDGVAHEVGAALGGGRAGQGDRRRRAAAPAGHRAPRVARVRRRRRSGVVPRGVFVTGTGTGVGKSVLAAVLCAALAARGERVAAFKPVVTGLDDPIDGWPRDHELLAAAAGSGQTPEEVSPVTFGPPVSPHLAAELAGVPIEPPELVAHAHSLAAEADVLVAEGVGGLLVPITPGYLIRDLALELGLPLVIASHPALGAINHSLLTIEAARAAGLRVAGVVLTPWPDDPGDVELSNLETIARLGDTRVDVLRHTTPADLAGAAAELPIDYYIVPA